ncbi:MAG: tRNA (adenosine(37)-N6)-threonylcarbamoyltransferase complex ATPase subunit type 1 TsaE [Planctomycetota bacterium]|jgi:tRNA threonylcarbamoyladenosine biosynthesis protein TsaE
MNLEIESRSEAHTQSIAAALASHLQAGDVITLSGPLGAGKTCFVRGLAQGLGLSPSHVSSPTFVICQEYHEDGRRLTLVHVDAYRLGGPGELADIGWEELLEAESVVIAVEWPEVIREALPVERIEIALEHAGIACRVISIRAAGEAAARLSGLESELVAPDRAIECPTCGKTVRRSDASFPFCSSRCRMADLGQWFSESYRISRPVRSDELD